MTSLPPPPPETRPKSRPIWTRWWIWAIVVVVLILVAAGVGTSQTDQTEAEAGSPSPAAIPSPTTPSPTSETVVVPDVIGTSSDIATSELETVGFVVDVQTKVTNSAPAGRVLQQSEAPGSSAVVGDTITLTVAEALPKLPRVVGDPLKRAKQTLKEAGFEVGRVKQQTSGKKKGTVISQSPASGTSTRPGRSVSLVTAKPAPHQSNNCTPGYSPCLPPASDTTVKAERATAPNTPAPFALLGPTRTTWMPTTMAPGATDPVEVRERQDVEKLSAGSRAECV